MLGLSLACSLMQIFLLVSLLMASLERVFLALPSRISPQSGNMVRAEVARRSTKTFRPEKKGWSCCNIFRWVPSEDRNQETFRRPRKSWPIQDLLRKWRIPRRISWLIRRRRSGFDNFLHRLKSAVRIGTLIFLLRHAHPLSVKIKVTLCTLFSFSHPIHLLTWALSGQPTGLSLFPSSC